VAGKKVTLKWRYSDFSTLTRQKGLQSPTSDPNLIYKTICRLVEGLRPLPQKVRLVGVALSHFEEEKPQSGLFDEKSLKSNRLNVSLDEITHRFGKGSIRKASLLDTPDDDDRANSFLKK
jgi:DNA polymerase-4